jgi:predicted nucleotidyltransferase
MRMAVPELPQDFKEFLKLLNDLEVKYLLVGGYAVGYYGYPRATADMDIWIAVSPDNAKNILTAFHQFGMRSPDLDADTFQIVDKVIRMGLPPMRIEVLTSIDGVLFDDCFLRRQIVELEGVKVPIISLDDLKKNKKASGRHKDLDDLEHLSS